MGSEDLFWKRKRNIIKRELGKRGPTKETFLIVCEGQSTEPNYFKSFKVTSARIVVEGVGCNTLSLVKKTILIIKEEQKKGFYYNQVWSVFDRDDHPIEQFNKAFHLAKKKKIKIAYSNEAFELWYLLHFQFFDSALSRIDYYPRLNKHLGFKYNKNSKVIYNTILDKQNTAIKNARTLIEKYGEDFNPATSNPSTSVFKLVEELNKYLK